MAPNLDYVDAMEKGQAGLDQMASLPSPASTTETSKPLVTKPDQTHNHPASPMEECPRGYPSVAAFLDSNENFMVYRRFGFLQSRLLLEKQDKLRELEEDLDTLDKEEYNKHRSIPTTRFNTKIDSEARESLLQRIEAAFCTYANILTAAHQLVSLNKPSSAEYTSVERYLDNNNPLQQEEASFVYHKEDLITLRPGREHAWLDAAVEKLLRWTHCNIIERMFCSKESKKKSKDPHNVYYTPDRIERFVVGIITSMILVLLIVPIYFLYHIVNGPARTTNRANALCMGILLVFTLAFSAVMSFFTRARRHEILAASAAYCAVLVVFLGNVGNHNN